MVVLGTNIAECRGPRESKDGATVRQRVKRVRTSPIHIVTVVLVPFPPPLLHCVRCHVDYTVNNRDHSCRMLHGDMQLQHARPHSRAHQGLPVLSYSCPPSTPFSVQTPWLRFRPRKEDRNRVLYISIPNYVSSPIARTPESIIPHTCMHTRTYTYAYLLSHSRHSAVFTKHGSHQLGRPRDRAVCRPTGLVDDRLPH